MQVGKALTKGTEGICMVQDDGRALCQLHTPLALPFMIKRVTIEITCINSQTGMENTAPQ